MVNLFTVKKWSGLFIVGFVPAFLMFFFLLFGYGIVLAIVAMMIAIILGIVIFGLLTRHPLMSLIQGEGLLVMTFDSTGVIEPFIVRVNPPFIKGKMRSGKEATSLFDRQAVFYTRNPKLGVINNTPTDDPDFEHYDLKVPKGKESSITFAFMQYPTFIYNKQMGAFLTKDSLAKIETEGIIKHLVLYLKVKTEELTSIMRDFARYVIELTRPKTSMFAGKGRLIMMLLFAVGIVIFVVLFLPSIISVLGPAFSAGKSAITGAGQQIAGTVKTVG